MDKHVAIIGGGNLGVAIAEGLVISGLLKPKQLTITRRHLKALEKLSKKGMNTTTNNGDAVRNAEIIILAVKPHQLKGVLMEIRSELKAEQHLVISVVTGVELPEIAADLGQQIPVFRAMPNTAIAIQESMTCISTLNGTEEQQKTVLSIFNSLGKALIIDDELMAAATVLGASGIAFAMRFIRAQSQGGIEIGFGANTAQLIAAQTVRGAASLLLERGHHPEWEIDKVTTPMGCTIAGLNEMEHRGFSSSLIKGIVSSHKKIARIAEGYEQ